MTPDDPTPVSVELCGGCGLAIAGGGAGCQGVFDVILARDVLDTRFARHHRLVVDIYALQHPDRYCASAKSLMAHLTGLCAAVDQPRHPALLRSLQQSLNGAPAIVRPALPAARGTLTIADVRDVADRADYSEAVDRWARATWHAYEPLHHVARAFVAEVMARA